MARKKSRGVPPEESRIILPDEYKDWVADEKDVRFDEIWRIVIVIAITVPTTLGGWLMYSIL